MTADDLDARLKKLKKMEKRFKSNKGTSIGLGILTGLGWLLFLYKMSQTSEFALRYSRSAQEEIGKWAMFLILMSAVTVLAALWTAYSGKKTRAAVDEMKSRLRAELASADESQRARIESQLRELGA